MEERIFKLVLKHLTGYFDLCFDIASGKSGKDAKLWRKRGQILEIAIKRLRRR